MIINGKEAKSENEEANEELLYNQYRDDSDEEEDYQGVRWDEFSQGISDAMSGMGDMERDEDYDDELDLIKDEINEESNESGTNDDDSSDDPGAFWDNM